MPKRTDIHKILVIGSGPIVIGQAAEFDYSGTQACLALREEGYEVVLINSNPATIMTDTDIADKVYMEPLNLEYVARIIRHERPDAILPSLGGQTGLNLAVQLAKKACLRNVTLKYSVLILKQLKEQRTESFSRNFAKASASRFFQVKLPKTLRTVLRLQKKSDSLLFFVLLLPLAVQAAALPMMKKNLW